MCIHGQQLRVSDIAAIIVHATLQIQIQDIKKCPKMNQQTTTRAQNYGMPIANVVIKFRSWQAKIYLICQNARKRCVGSPKLFSIFRPAQYHDHFHTPFGMHMWSD